MLEERKMKCRLLVLTTVCLGMAFNVANAKPLTEEQAATKVGETIIKHKLTTLKRECYGVFGGDDMYFDEEKNVNVYRFDIHEIHNEICGGDPETAPRMMSFEVEVNTGKMCTDSIEWANRLGVEDPGALECNPIK